MNEWLCFVLVLVGIFLGISLVWAVIWSLGSLVIRIIGCQIYYWTGMWDKFDNQEVIEAVARQVVEDWERSNGWRCPDPESLLEAKSQMFEAFVYVQRCYVRKLLLKWRDLPLPVKEPRKEWMKVVSHDS